MNLKSSTIFLIFLISILASLAANSQTNETVNLDDFDALIASGNIELILIPDTENYAEVEVQKTSLDKLEIKMKGSTLKFKLKNKGLFNLFGGEGIAYIKLHFTDDLERISSSAAADIHSKGVISTNDLRLKSSSGASITLELDCIDVDATVSSGAEINLDGTFDMQEISVSSGASYEANNVKSKEVLAKASSGGHIKVWATDKLKGKASSGGSIDYKGNPTRKDIASSSGGSVRSN